MDVTSLHRSVGSAASMRGDIFYMNNEQIELYKLYHAESNIELKLELAKKIYELNKVFPVQEFWKDSTTQNLEGEEWGLINRWRKHYEASSFGRIRCWYDYTNGGEVKLSTPRIIKQHLNIKEGYLMCGINRSRKDNFPYKVNWLVAYAFYPYSDILPESNHVDGVKTNNYKINLEWCDRSYNMKHAFYCGLRPFYDNDNHHHRKLSKVEIQEVLSSKEDYSLLATKYKVSIPTIRRVKMGETYKHITKGIKNRVRREKLSSEIALEIFKSNKKTRDLCIEYNTTEWVVQRIKSGETFSKITGKKRVTV